jgi:hypothetical protein
VGPQSKNSVCRRGFFTLCTVVSLTK